MIVPRREKVRVGLFLLVSASVAAGVALALAGLTTTPTVRFHSIFEESISGLDEAAPVKYQGKKVGKVARIGIDHESLLPLIEYEVEPATPVRDDTIATLVVQGYATGLRYIELTKGNDPKAAPLAPGSRIQSRQSAFTQLDRIASDAKEALDQIRRLMGSIERGVATATARIDPTMDGVDRTVSSLERTLEQGRGALEENRPNVKVAVEELREAIAALRGIAGDLQREESVKKATAALASLDKAAGSLGRLAESADRVLAKNAEALEEIVQNLRAASRDLAETARDVKQRPALLIRDVPRGVREGSE